MKIFAVDEPLFKTEPLFILGCPWDQLVAYCRHRWPKLNLGDPPPATVCGSMMTLEGPPWRLVWTAGLDLPVVLHEVFHLVTRICQDKGVPIRAHFTEVGENGDETAAYLFEFFTRAVCRRLRVRAA